MININKNISLVDPKISSRSLNSCFLIPKIGKLKPMIIKLNRLRLKTTACHAIARGDGGKIEETKMKLKNIALIALLFGSATVVHHVNAMEYNAELLESHVGADPTSQGGGGESDLDGDQDTERGMTDTEHKERYGERSWFGSGRTDQQKTNVSIDKGNGTYGKTSPTIEGTRGDGTTFAAYANGETSGQARNDANISVRRGLRDMTTSEYNKKYGKDSWWSSFFRSSDQRDNRKVDKENGTYGKTEIEALMDADEVGRLLSKDLNKNNDDKASANFDERYGIDKTHQGYKQHLSDADNLMRLAELDDGNYDENIKSATDTIDELRRKGQFTEKTWEVAQKLHEIIKDPLSSEADKAQAERKIADEEYTGRGRDIGRMKEYLDAERTEKNIQRANYILDASVDGSNPENDLVKAARTTLTMDYAHENGVEDIDRLPDEQVNKLKLQAYGEAEKDVENSIDTIKHDFGIPESQRQELIEKLESKKVDIEAAKQQELQSQLRSGSNDSGYNDGLELTQVSDLKYGELQGKLKEVQAALDKDQGNVDLEAIKSHIESRINSESNLDSGIVNRPTSSDDDKDDMFTTSDFSNPFGAPPEEANTFSAQADSNAKRKGINRRNAMRSPNASNARQRVKIDSGGNKIFESPSELGFGVDDTANDSGNSGDEFEGNNSKREPLKSDMKKRNKFFDRSKKNVKQGVTFFSGGRNFGGRNSDFDVVSDVRESYGKDMGDATPEEQQGFRDLNNSKFGPDTPDTDQDEFAKTSPWSPRGDEEDDADSYDAKREQTRRNTEKNAIPTSDRSLKSARKRGLWDSI